MPLRELLAIRILPKGLISLNHAMRIVAQVSIQHVVDKQTLWQCTSRLRLKAAHWVYAIFYTFVKSVATLILYETARILNLTRKGSKRQI